MFVNIKRTIKDLAKNAVFVAESELGTGKGQEKKQMAIKYVTDNLPFSSVIKNIISIFLSSFIDDAIEAAVTYFNSLPEEKEN